MIACYPLEPDVLPPPPPPQSVSAAASQPVSNFFQGEQTECNYLVLAFIIGVLFLAFTDSIKR